MSWLFILAGFMAIFAVIGYLRGWRAALFILIMTFFGVIIIARFGDVIIRYINAFCKGFQFLLSGGLSALTGGGGADAALQALGDAPACVQASDETLVLGLLLVITILLGVLLSSMAWLQGEASFFGLILGLMTGYLIAAVVVRAVAPEYAALVPLPFGIATPCSPCPVVIVPGEGSSLVSRTLDFLTSLADRGLIAAFLGTVIAVFVIMAARTGGRGAQKE